MGPDGVAEAASAGAAAAWLGTLATLWHVKTSIHHAER